MRIGFDISRALAPSDGTGIYTAELLRALMAILPESDELLLYNLIRPLDLELFAAEYPAVPDNVVPRPASRPQDDGLELFHANTWIVPPAFRGRIVFTCYDLTTLSHADCHTLSTKIHCLKATLEALLAGATFVAISEATAEELRRRLGVDPSRIRVILPAAAPTFAPRDLEAAKARLLRRFAVEPPYVLSVGTLEPRKNLRRLIEAWTGLPDAVRERHPLIAAGGAGWKLDVEELGDLRHLGFVDREDLADLYSAATLFAYPSLAEGFGLPVLEAMACGAPVLTSITSSLPEVAGGAARLVDPGDVEAIRQALWDLLRQPDELAALRRRGLERAAAFSWQKTARETLELYRDLLRARLPATDQGRPLQVVAQDDGEKDHHPKESSGRGELDQR